MSGIIKEVQEIDKTMWEGYGALRFANPVGVAKIIYTAIFTAMLWPGEMASLTFAGFVATTFLVTGTIIGMFMVTAMRQQMSDGVVTGLEKAIFLAMCVASGFAFYAAIKYTVGWFV